MHRQSIWMPPYLDYRCSHLHHPQTFMPNALAAAILPIHPGLGQAPNNAGLHTQWLGY